MTHTHVDNGDIPYGRMQRALERMWPAVSTDLGNWQAAADNILLERHIVWTRSKRQENVQE